MDDLPKVGSWWTHKNGNRYQVKAVANTASTNDNPDYPPTVVYQGAYGHWWTRPLSKWHDSMTPLNLGA